MKSNDCKRRKDAEEEWQYRLSMDKRRQQDGRLKKFYTKYLAWFRQENETTAQQP